MGAEHDAVDGSAPSRDVCVAQFIIARRFRMKADQHMDAERRVHAMTDQRRSSMA